MFYLELLKKKVIVNLGNDKFVKIIFKLLFID